MRIAYKKRELTALRSAIKGLSQEIKDFYKKEILPKKGKKRAIGRYRHQQIKKMARIHYLAYALLLGKRYDQIEEKRPCYCQYQSFIQERLAEQIIRLVAAYLPNGFYGISGIPSKEYVFHWFKTGENLAFQIEKPGVFFLKTLPKEKVEKKSKKISKKSIEDRNVA